MSNREPRALGTVFKTCYESCIHQSECEMHHNGRKQYKPHIECIKSFKREAGQLQVAVICHSFQVYARPTPKQILKEGLKDTRKPEKKPNEAKYRNRMAPEVASAFLEYLEKAEASYWRGIARDARDQLDKAKGSLENGVQAIFGLNKHGNYWGASIQRFGLAFYAAMPIIRKAGWSVHMQTIPGVGYYYEIRKKAT